MLLNNVFISFKKKREIFFKNIVLHMFAVQIVQQIASAVSNNISHLPSLQKILMQRHATWTEKVCRNIVFFKEYMLFLYVVLLNESIGI